MSTKSASTPRRRSSPASQRKGNTKVRSKRGRAVAARAATPKRRVASGSSRRSTATAAAPAPLSGRAISAARAKLAKLGTKWKELLPKLKKVATH